MLREADNVSQFNGELPRRWFSDAYFDLIVWQDEDGGLQGFQLSYDKTGRERLIEWRRGNGVSHFRVDRADARPARHARSGFLVPEEVGDLSEVLVRFGRASANMEPSLASAIQAWLRSAGPSPGASDRSGEGDAGAGER